MPDLSIYGPDLELDALATTAGFRKATPPEVDIPAPPDLKFWSSDFGFLALVGVPENDAEALDQTFLNASGWISRALKAQEKLGNLIDGYLLLAMQSKPDGLLLADVRRIESNTSVCRKHVLWPDPDRTWTATLYAVTTLGLPSATPTSHAVTDPELPFAANRALFERENGASFDEVASLMEELSESEPELGAHVD